MMEVFEFPDGIELRPVHPGRTLAAELAARSVTTEAVARELNISADLLDDVVRGQQGISPETALRLGRYFGMSAEFWLNMQSAYDLAIAKQSGAEIERERAGGDTQ